MRTIRSGALLIATALGFAPLAVGQERPPATDPATRAPAADLEARLAAARQRWAAEYLGGPRPGLELAKLHFEAGHEELAVSIAEETRRSCGDDAFDAAYFEEMQIVPDPEPSAEVARELAALGEAAGDVDWGTRATQARAGLERHPESSELWFELARALERQGEDPREAYDHVVALAPHSPNMIGPAARHRLKVAKELEGAFALYQRVYLLAPHYYDGEFAAERITQQLGPEISSARYLAARDRGDFRAALRADTMWGTDRAIAKLRKEWKPEFVADLGRMLRHDSSTVRWQATELLCEFASDVPAERLSEWLRDDDARVRGLALYVAVKRDGEASFPAVRAALGSELVLLRFDALSALSMHGGAAGAALRDEHAAKEQHPKLQEILRSAKR